MASGAAAERGILLTLQDMYVDFAAFTLKGNVLFQNIFSMLICRMP